MNFQPFSWNSPAEKKIAYNKAKDLDYKDFWHHEAQALTWHKPFEEIHDNKFAQGNWFINGKVNASFNCLDRHLINNSHKIAITFENEEGTVQKLSYKELYELTCHIATILHNRGIKAGDRVAIYMPLTPQAIASMLAVARIGGIHTVIFAGFAKESLIDRIEDCQAAAIITSKSTKRKGQEINLKNIVDEAIKDPRCQSIDTILSFDCLPSTNEKEVNFSIQEHWPDCVSNPHGFDAQHPLFILYTSGTTGKPKGIFHATGGYLVQVACSTKWSFDLIQEDTYWCSADVGWITGHSYVTYGPLLLGKSIFIFEGALNYPNPKRVYELIEKHKITVFYTAPTAVRMFMAAGEQYAQESNLSSLRLLGSVGEPINPEAFNWYKKVFGNNSCPVLDTWWQTETGSIMIAPLPDIHHAKPGFAAIPLLGIDAKIVDENGKECSPNQSGFLVIKQPWPSLARGIWNDQKRFLKTYFEVMPNVYFTGDGAFADLQGHINISGRIDDVVNVSGHRLGTAEIESALITHNAVAEAAVVGISDAITGQKLIAFVTLMPNSIPSSGLEEELKNQVKNIIGSFAKPAAINFTKILPKTRSGKIMRRLLRSIANGEKITTDISTLEDKSFLEKVL